MTVTDSRKRTARVAGLWYLGMALSGPVGIVYVPSKILVAGDAAATGANIAAHSLLLRVGIASNLFCQVSFVFLMLALLRLFRGVDEGLEKMMGSLVIAAVPIAIVNELVALAALEVGSGAAYLSPLAADERSALALMLLNLHHVGIAVAGIFWGLWLLPFGLLVMRSRFIPPVLGVLLIVGCFAYLIDSSFALLAPQHRAAVQGVLALPLAAGEISMVLWLLIKGAREAEAPQSPA